MACPSDAGDPGKLRQWDIFDILEITQYFIKMSVLICDLDK